MGIFGRRKRREESEVLNISGRQLIELLNKSVQQIEEEIGQNCYSVSSEIIFEYKEHLYFTGARYNVHKAKKENKTEFSEEYLTVYLDEAFFPSVEEMAKSVELDGKTLDEITEGILVEPEFGEML